MISFPSARTTVLREVRARVIRPDIEMVALGESRDRVLAADILADRDYPPFHRAMRDGFALRAVDIEKRLRVVGESRAGSGFQGRVEAGEAVEIMTGAPVPAGADVVVMVEYCTRFDDGTVETTQRLQSGANISPRGL